MLKRISSLACAAVLLAGCAVQSVKLGTPRDEVVKTYGTPTRAVALPSGSRLQYSQQPNGQSVVNVDLNAAGSVVSVREVMNENAFARIEVSTWTREDVEREFGQPASIGHVMNWKGDILAYRWYDGIQDMFFWAYLDDKQVVQQVGRGMEIRNYRNDSR